MCQRSELRRLLSEEKYTLSTSLCVCLSVSALKYTEPFGPPVTEIYVQRRTAVTNSRV